MKNELIEIDKQRDGHTAPAISGDREAWVVRFSPEGGGVTYGVQYLRMGTVRPGDVSESTGGGQPIPTTALAPVAPRLEEISERVTRANFGGGWGWADTAREVHGDFMQVAFLPASKTKPLEFERGRYVPRWMREFIEKDAASLLSPAATLTL